MRFRAAVAASLLMIAPLACDRPSRPGAIGGKTPAASGSGTRVTAGPTASGKRVVTRSDAGRTVELRVGDSLEVQLPSAFRPAAAHADGVLVRTSSSGGYPTGESMIAVFRADATGRVDVESTTDYQCLHATPSCALPQEQWSVHVVVMR